MGDDTTQQPGAGDAGQMPGAPVGGGTDMPAPAPTPSVPEPEVPTEGGSDQPAVGGDTPPAVDPTQPAA